MRQRQKMGTAPTVSSLSRSNRRVLVTAVIVFRFFQYCGATILLGSSLFFIYGLPKTGPCAASTQRWPKLLIILSSAVLIISAVMGLISQTGLLAGSFGEGLKLANLQAVVTQMNFGWSNITRALIAMTALISVTALKPSSVLWTWCSILGVIVCSSFAWMGHGAATPGAGGYFHLLADIAHSLAAAVWIGALVVFVFWLWSGQSSAATDLELHDSLRAFSGIGSAAVAVLVVTGLINSWFLVGVDRLSEAWTTLYAQVLIAKLAVFIGMLGLAASNRYRLTPALGSALDSGGARSKALTALKVILVSETLAAFIVFALVAWLGTLAPASVH
jgi:putative copper resistance protein D